MDPTVQSHVGTVFGKHLSVGNPRRISSGRTVSHGRDAGAGEEREEEEQYRLSVMK